MVPTLIQSDISDTSLWASLVHQPCMVSKPEPKAKSGSSSTSKDLITTTSGRIRQRSSEVMERLYGSLLKRSFRVNGSNTLAEMGWKCQRCRMLSTTDALRAKPNKTAPKTGQPKIVQQKKPLEYKSVPFFFLVNMDRKLIDLGRRFVNNRPSLLLLLHPHDRTP